jgi:hypothetical protein
VDSSGCVATAPWPPCAARRHAGGPALTFFDSGCISRRKFWTPGLVVGLFFLATLLDIGIPYLTYLYPVAATSATRNLPAWFL